MYRDNLTYNRPLSQLSSLAGTLFHCSPIYPQQVIPDKDSTILLSINLSCSQKIARHGCMARFTGKFTSAIETTVSIPSKKPIALMRQYSLPAKRPSTIA